MENDQRPAGAHHRLSGNGGAVGNADHVGARIASPEGSAGRCPVIEECKGRSSTRFLL